MNFNKKISPAENGRPIRSKLWIIFFLLFLLIGCSIYMMICYRANPLGYFTNAQNLDYNYSDDYTRSIKSIYVKDHKDEIDAVILGGSKAGVLDPALLTEYTGLRYYNMNVNVSNFADYLRCVEFLLRDTDVKEITIHLSNFETVAYDQTHRGSNFEVPSVWTGKLYDKVTEFLAYLMTDTQSVKKALTTRIEKGSETAETLSIGMKNRASKYISFMTDPDDYVASNAMKRYKKHIRALFRKHYADTDEYDNVRTQNLNALKEIKRLCDEKGVTLKVLFGAGFIGEKYLYECNDFYDYMASVVDIVGEVWDFSGFSDINLNPYNFIDNKHISNALGDLVINTMYGQDAVDGFGFLMTRDNVYEHLAERKQDYARLEAEYNESGTIAVYGMDHESYIPWINQCVWSGERDKEIISDEALAKRIEKHRNRKEKNSSDPEKTDDDIEEDIEEET